MPLRPRSRRRRMRDRYRGRMSAVRRLLVPAVGGVVAAFLVVGVLVAHLATQHDGAGLGSIALGLMILGPWGLLIALPLCVGGGLGAGALSPRLRWLPPRFSLALLFVAFVGGSVALVVSVWIPFSWWPSGLAALVLVVITAIVTAVIASPGHKKGATTSVIAPAGARGGT